MGGKKQIPRIGGRQFFFTSFSRLNSLYAFSFTTVTLFDVSCLLLKPVLVLHTTSIELNI